MSQIPLVTRILALSSNAAKRAGKIVREVMSSNDLGIVMKDGKHDVQTEADRSSQKCIFASLCREFPKVKIIGEEGHQSFSDVPKDWIVTESDSEVLSKPCPEVYHKVKDEDVVVWVDPLDGTKEFTDGFYNHVTVLIGVSVNGRAIGGIIHQPFYDFKPENIELGGRTIWGLVGLGIFGIEVTPPPMDKFIVTTTRSHLDANISKAFEALKPDEVLKVGGAGYKVLALIEGRAHFYIFPSKGCKKWDTCAPEAVLEAAGGVLTDIINRRYSYDAEVEHPNAFGVFASPKGQNHEELLSKMPKEVVERFVVV